jgi:hypothetical protein
MNIQDLSQWASIIGVPMALIGLCISYISLKNKNDATVNRVNSLQQLIELKNQYSSGGSQYHECKFYQSPQNSTQVENEFEQGIRNKSKGGNNG